MFHTGRIRTTKEVVSLLGGDDFRAFFKRSKKIGSLNGQYPEGKGPFFVGRCGENGKVGTFEIRCIRKKICPRLRKFREGNSYRGGNWEWNLEGEEKRVRPLNDPFHRDGAQLEKKKENPKRA